MKHLITHMLIIIAPLMMSAEMIPKIDFGNPSFEIIAHSQIFAANPLPSNQRNGCKATVFLESDVKGKSNCSSSNLLHYHVTIDLKNDGIIDMIASSSFDPGYGNTWRLDSRDKIKKTYVAPDTMGDFRFKLPSFILDEGSMHHKVLWKVSDICGDLSESASIFTVVDKKAPTPYCVSMSHALFTDTEHLVELWARDFDKGGFDNCTQQSNLVFTFDGVPPIYDRLNEEHYYKASATGSVPAIAAEYAQGKAYKWLPVRRSAGFIWTKTGTYNVNVSVWDEAWNTDYCTTVLITAYTLPCIGTFTVKFKSVKNKGIEGAYIMLADSLIEFPKQFITDKTGSMPYIPLICFAPYSVSAEYNDRNTTGIDISDLNLLNAHLAGKKAFKHAWQYIAADLNNDGVITDSDAVTLANWLKDNFEPKWKIIVANEKLTANNWNTYKSNSSFTLTGGLTSINFTALKVGDINGDILVRQK